MTPEQMAQQNEQSTAAIAREIGAKLPGPTDLPPAASALPDDVTHFRSASRTTRRRPSA